MLRIAVIAHDLRVAGGLSVGRNMIASLGRTAPEHKYLFVIPAGLGYEEICHRIPGSCVEIYQHKGGVKGGVVARLRFDTFVLPAIVRKFKPDLLFVLGGTPVRNSPCPQIIHPQDAHTFYPLGETGVLSLAGRLRCLYRRFVLRSRLSSVRLVLCQTKVVEERMRRTLGYTGRALVCSSAVSSFMSDGEHDGEVPAPLAAHADKMKLFYLAKYYPHKNIEGIVKAFDIHRNELEGVVVFITIAADGSAAARKLLDSIDRLGLRDRIINVGPIPHALVGSYYRHSDALLMPTLLETFGLPYLEAMSHGLPILTSDLDFAHCVCGDAALFFDPRESRSMRDAILRLKDDPHVAEQLAVKGKARATVAFRSWDEIVGEIAGLFSEIAGGQADAVTARA